MKYLLTGIPGTGKTTVGNILKDSGFKFIDSDTEPKLAHWVNSETGEHTDPVDNADASWYETHSWNLDLVRLAEILASYSGKGNDVIVCGMATNLIESFSFYDKAILLKGDYEVIKRRILARSDKPDPESVETIFSWAESFETEVKKAGAIVIDASGSAEDVAEAVIESLSVDRT